MHWWPFAIPDMLFHSSIYETTDRITIAKCLVRKPLGSIEMIFQEGNESKFLVHRKFTCVWSNSLLSGWWRRIPATAVAYETLSWSRNPRKSGYFWLSIVKGRRVIENAFCILAAPWWAFLQPIQTTVDNAEIVVEATICLHNFLRQTKSDDYCPTGFVDSWNKKGEIKKGLWRSLVAESQSSTA